jgi:hypothetical protein
MPKSTGPLSEQLGLGTANQSTPNNTTMSGNVTDNTTAAADKLGANKGTNAIPQQNPSVISSAGAIGKQCMSLTQISHLLTTIRHVSWG